MSTDQQVSMAFWLRHIVLDWQTNPSAYSFPLVGREGIEVAAIKRSDGGLDFSIDGPHKSHFDISTDSSAMKRRIPEGIAVVIAWERKILHLRLNGKLIKTVTVASARSGA